MKWMIIAISVMLFTNTGYCAPIGEDANILDTEFFYVELDANGENGRAGAIETLYFKPYSTSINLADGIYGGLQAGNFIPEPGIVEKDTSYRIKFNSDGFFYGGDNLPLATELTVSVNRYTLSFVYTMTAVEEVELPEGLEVDFVLANADSISGFTNGAQDFYTSLDSSTGGIEKYYMNQRFAVTGAFGVQNISIRNPFESRVSVSDFSGQGGYFTVMFFEAEEPLYALPGPKYHSTLPAGYTFKRKIEINFNNREFDPDVIPLESAIYFSPHKNGADGTIMFMWDEIPSPPEPGPGEWDIAYTEDDDATYLVPAIKTLNDHPNIKYVWLITPDLIGPINYENAIYEGTGDPYAEENWAYWHSSSRVNGSAPSEWINWVKDIESNNSSYSWMARVGLGNHNYHHSTSLDDTYGHESIYYNFDRDMRLFSSAIADIQAIGLDNAISTMCMRFAGFKHTQSSIVALISNGIKFFCDGKRFTDDIYPSSYHYSHYVSPDGELRGLATTWWSDYKPNNEYHGRPYSFIQYTLDRKKPTLLGGHFLQTWHIDYLVESTARFEEFLSAMDADYPMARWELPQDYHPFIVEMSDFDRLIVSQHKPTGTEVGAFECNFHFTGETNHGETVIFEDGTNYEPRYAFVDGNEVDISRRSGYYFIVLPDLPEGEHIISFYSDKMFSEPKPFEFVDVYTYPNPTDGPIILKAALTNQVSKITADIYTISGDWINSIDEFDFNPSNYTYEAVWRITNNRGAQVTSGVYLCLITATLGDKQIKTTHKIAVLK